MKTDRHGQGSADHDCPDHRGPEAGHALPLPGGGRERGRRRGAGRTSHLHHLRLRGRNQRSLPERPRAPADRLGPAARLPRLRARLGGEHAAATTSSPTSSPARPRSADYPKRRTRAANRGCSTESTTAASPAPATRPTAASTPTSRRAAADGWTTEYVGIPADGTPSTAPVQLVPAGSRRRPRHVRLRRARNLLAVLRRRQHRQPDPPAGRRTRAGHGRLDPQPERRTGRLTSASTSRPTAPTSSSARPRQLEPDGNNNGDVYDLRPQPGSRRHPRRLEDARRAGR